MLITADSFNSHVIGYTTQAPMTVSMVTKCIKDGFFYHRAETITKRRTSCVNRDASLISK